MFDDGTFLRIGLFVVEVFGHCRLMFVVEVLPSSVGVVRVFCPRCSSLVIGVGVVRATSSLAFGFTGTSFVQRPF